MVHNDSSALVRFSNFCEDFRPTNCGVSLRIDRPTIIKWNSHHMTSFADETGDHLLRGASSTNNFRCIWVVFKDPHGRLLFCFGLIRTDPWFVTCDDLINVFWSSAIVIFQRFLTPMDTNRPIDQSTTLFWAICKLSGLQREIFLRPGVHAILNVC